MIPTGPHDPQVQGEPVRTWRFVADLHDSLRPGRNRLLVATQWLWIYLANQRHARLITGERKAALAGSPGVQPERAKEKLEA